MQTQLSSGSVGPSLCGPAGVVWYADVQGEGTYQETAPGVKELRSAPFKLRSVFFVDGRKQTRWLGTYGPTGWWTSMAAASTVFPKAF